MIKTAVILAAGLGTRFGRMTESMPKGFIEFKGIPMIVRSVETLLDCGIERIIIGTGYHQEYYEGLRERYSQVITVFSEKYAETNSMYTLYNSRREIGEDDFLLLESDLIYEKKAISALLEDTHPDTMLIAGETKFQDQYFVEHDDRGNLVGCSVDRKALNVCGELVGIHKISHVFYGSLCGYYRQIIDERPKLGYEYGLLYVAQHLLPLYVLKIPGLKWYEIDDEADLAYAEKYICP